jgi:hypothetical protein
MGFRLRRTKDDNRAADRLTCRCHILEAGNDSFPLQVQVSENRQTRKGESVELDDRLTLKPSSKQGQFSMEIPGQISAEIDSPTGTRGADGPGGESLVVVWEHM